MENWHGICTLDDIPVLGARVVRHAGGAICIFRNADDEVFALDDRCPHKNGPLSQGIVHGRSVTCPLHGWTIDLASGSAQAPDRGCVRTHAVKVEGGMVRIALAPACADESREAVLPAAEGRGSATGAQA